MFEKGHKLNVGRKNPNAGRKKLPSTIIKEATEHDAQNIPKYFEVLSDKAKDGDRESLFYLLDRHLGKPKLGLPNLEDGNLGVGIIVGLLKAVREVETREEYRIANKQEEKQGRMRKNRLHKQLPSLAGTEAVQPKAVNVPIKVKLDGKWHRLDERFEPWRPSMDADGNVIPELS